MKLPRALKPHGILACVVALALQAAAALAAGEPLPREVSIRGVEFVLVPEGWSFKTGGIPRGAEDSGGNLKIWLDAFYIARHEARARDLEPFLNGGEAGARSLYGGDTESCSLRAGDGGRYFVVDPAADLPATHLSWNLATRWARWMGFRLPTEAEWEKAARGTDQRTYPWGNDPPDETYANFNVTSQCLVWPVTRLSKGQSPYGALNMAGNVREYIADGYDPEFDKTLVEGARNPAAPRGRSNEVMLKGGRWASTPETIRISSRVLTSPDKPFQCNGTRFAIDAAAVREHLVRGTAAVLRP
jgi:formylglycine-generating enzyme required for sulfatase activity